MPPPGLSRYRGAILGPCWSSIGEDADTTGAVYGQLAGAYYGVEAIPEQWGAKLARLDLLENAAAALFREASE